VTSKKPQGAKRAVDGRVGKWGNSREPARELCLCGHRAGRHAALKYSCLVRGDYKGYCPCMRFIPGKASRGVGLRPRGKAPEQGSKE
jgi:hypothetical protein